MIFTFGLLLLATSPVSRWLLVVPFAWSLIGGSAAFLLGIPLDWLLLFSGLSVPIRVAASFWGMAVQAVGIAATATGAGMATFALGAVLLGMGTVMVYPTLLAAIGDVAHPDRAGRRGGGLHD